MMIIRSPITGLSNTRIIEDISVGQLKNLYLGELGISVDSYFENLSHISVVECQDTGYRFYYPLSIMGDEYLYDQLKINLPLYFNSPYYPESKWEYNIALKYIKNNHRVLEIGCGSGSFLDKVNNSQSVGLELNVSSVDYCMNKGHTVYNESIESFSRNNRGLFDVVCMFQVLEHIADVKQFLEASISTLKQNGLLIISVPYNNPYLFENDKYNTLNLPPHHMGLWNSKSFKKLTKYFPIIRVNHFIEKLPLSGYDYNRYNTINNEGIFLKSGLLRKVYFRFFHAYLPFISGKNIVYIYRRK